MKTQRILYFSSTGLLTLVMLFSAGNYFFNNAAIQDAFASLGFPLWMIYPLAILKLLGLVAIWTKLSAFLKEWAYAGFFFNTLAAATAHTMVGDGQQVGAILGMIFVVTSYYFDGKLYGNTAIPNR